MATTRRVGVFIPTSVGVEQGIRKGIQAFCQAHSGWKLVVVGGAEKKMFESLAAELDGVIAWAKTLEFADALEAWGKPCVNVLGSGRPSSNLPIVACDNRAIGRAGAEYLLDLGFRRLAFLGFQHYRFSQLRQEAFLEMVRQSGGSSFVHQVDTNTTDWPSIWKTVTHWVSTLPMPIGVMAANDSLGLEVLNACNGLGIRVPAQAAVLGMGNDLLICQRTNPPLSSIEQDFARIGFQAATLLETMMSGKPVPGGITRFPPTEVVTRASTDTVSLADPQLAKAVHYIREHACDPMQVKDLLNVVPMSRRSLEMRFFQVLGRSPHEEIRRLQLQRATRLLAQPQLSVDEVARASGFGRAEEMIRVFHRELGMTPGEHRRRFGPVAVSGPDPCLPNPAGNAMESA